MSDEIRVLVADDHPIVRKGLRAMIEEDEGLRVVGEAGDGLAALEMIQRLKPQVAVIDIDMPKLDGFGLMRELNLLSIPVSVIFLTLHTEEDMFRAALELGCKGYLLKDSAMQEIAVGVRVVASGQMYLSSAVTSRLLQRADSRDQGEAAEAKDAKDALTGKLTPTEQRIMKLIAEGKSSKEIGGELSIHYRTVENHRTNICRKLDIDGANALIRFALQHKASL
jgi:DNA-binding NarL/FixJ family response regulator